jgi:uncharacterized RDD family membrane protein YckC
MFTGILVGLGSGIIGAKLFSGRNDIVSGMILLMVHALVVEPVSFALSGRTAGKTLFNISVVNEDLSPLNFVQALQRSVNVWARGLGLGIPLVSLITTIHQYQELTKKGAATYDRDGGYRITHGEITGGRAVLLTGFVVVFIALIAIGAAAE